MNRTVLYICYYNLNEPLVQTQVVSYLRELAGYGIKVHLLTFERERFPREQKRKMLEELERQGIHWHSLRYHQRPSLPATLYDIAAGAVASFFICRKHGINLIHARSYVSAAMAMILKRAAGCLVLFDVRGLLADEYRDSGHWSSDDLKYRLTKRMESVFFRKADAFVVLTERIKHELALNEPALRNRVPDMTVIPCCVDVDKFSVKPEDAAAYRRERGWGDRRVLTYVGKLGTWYLAEEMARFFAVARLVIPGLFFQVLTQSEGAVIDRALRANNVPLEDYDIRFAPVDHLPLVLAASDAGISFIRPCYSKLSSSPTKIGEYLAAGLPVVSGSGIGDCDSMLAGNGLGVILNEFSDAEYRRAAGTLDVMIRDAAVPSRCRDFASRELSMKNVGGRRYAAVYEGLLEFFARQPLVEDSAAGESRVGLSSSVRGTK